MSKKTFSIILFFLIYNIAVVLGQEADGGDLINIDDLDSIFSNENNGENVNSNDKSENSEQQKENTQEVLEELLNTSGFTFKADFQLFTGYSPGINTLFPAENDKIIYLGSILFGMSSNFTLDYNISKNFRVLQKISVAYPNFNFVFNEFFADYTLYDFLFFRLGMQKIKWGESRNYSFANLPNRLPDNYEGDKQTIALKLSMPIGIGGMEILTLTRKGFWQESPFPAFNDMGFGLKNNFFLWNMDINIGLFYHYELFPKAFVSLKTTLFDTLELYSEGIISVDPVMTDNTMENGKIDNPIDFGFDIGLYNDFFDGFIETGLEYYYNGEETQLTVIGDQFPLFWGHNISFYIGFNIKGKNPIKIFAQAMYSDSTISGIIVPGITMDLSSELMLSIVSSIFLGDNIDGYPFYNPDPLKRNMFSALRLIFHGKI